MENNWPEIINELMEECRMLVSKNDLYELGKRGEPFTGEYEPRVDGTDYLAGEYQYGVAMIPAQWVTHVLENTTLGRGECECYCTIEWKWTGPTTYYEHELSCGHVITSVDNDPPNFCEECGAKVRKVAVRDELP